MAARSASSTSRQQDAGHAESLQPGHDERARQVRIPAGPVDRVLHAGPPAIGAQSRMTGHPVSRAGVAIEVQGIRGHEPGQITGGRAGQARALPVDDPEHPAALDQQVARPEVTVHDGLRRPVVRQATAQAGQIGQVGIGSGLAAEPAADHVRDSVQHLRQAGVLAPGRGAVQSGQPAAGGGEVGGHRLAPGRMPPGVVRREHRLPGHRGHDEHGPAQVLDGGDDLRDRRAHRPERPAADLGQLRCLAFDAARRGVGGRHLGHVGRPGRARREEQDGHLRVRVPRHRQAGGTAPHLIDEGGQCPRRRYGHSARPTSTAPPARSMTASSHDPGYLNMRSPAVSTMLSTCPAPGGTDSTESAR